MVMTPSTMLALGTPAPNFKLTDVVSGKEITLASFAGKQALLIMFICSHCPFVKHVESVIAKIGRDYANKNLGIIAISANDPENHPEDGPVGLKLQAERLKFIFPYCFDETQAVAKAYTAACTPDFFLFDKNRQLVYRGQLDDSRPGNNIPVTGKDLRQAIEAVLNNQPVNLQQKPSVGCNIKWKPGNEPAYVTS